MNQVDVPVAKTTEKANEKQGPLRTPLALKLCEDKFRDGLLRWVRKRVDHHEDAEDVVSLAMVRALRRERRGPAWDPDSNTTAGLHMVKFLKSALAGHNQRKETCPDVPTEDMAAFASEDTSPGERVARRIEANERRQLANELHRELVASGDDPIGVRVLEAISEGGTDDLVFIASRADLTVAEVEASMKRLSRRGRAALSAVRQQARFQ